MWFLVFACVARIVNFSDARSNLKSVIDQVIEDADITVIARRDAPDAVVMSFDHYNGLMETVHLLSWPANAAFGKALLSDQVGTTTYDVADDALVVISCRYHY